MRLTLALASLRRNTSRTLLAILGVTIAAAMLLDMVMLSTGLRESFRELLLSRGFQLRLAPKGTLPFDTDATIAGAARIIAALRANPGVETISPVLGSSVHVPVDSGAVSSFALGNMPAVQGDYDLLRGHDPTAGNALVANAEFLRAAHAQVGDTIMVAAGYSPQLRSAVHEQRFVITGEARFIYLSSGEPAVDMPLNTLQQMTGNASDDRVSLLMVRAREGVNVDSLGAWIERQAPRVQAISTREALQQVDQRLSYFRQLSYILGAVSLAVGFLLVSTLVTVSVNERVGQIAVMRAIGVSRPHVVQQILLESSAISIAGAIAGLVLGLGTARYLNAILSSFPGLPARIDFFLFQPRAAWIALGLLVVSGIVAGIYPSWRAASLPVARTLREEAVV
ncbi:MAG TPA: FtsX-like permease family protein [Gemmatimonadaceae bacterium]|nr:FtsX-like permease family protein [Gemmatimonadaceae bacterium]